MNFFKIFRLLNIISLIVKNLATLRRSNEKFDQIQEADADEISDNKASTGIPVEDPRKANRRP
jgi:hypothetical protein